MRTKELNVIIVILYDESGWDGDKLRVLENDIEDLRPDHYEFGGAQAVHIAFRHTIKNVYKVEMFLQGIEARIAADRRFRHVQTGRQDGPCLCRVDAFGRINSVSLGNVAYQAMRSAMTI